MGKIVYNGNDYDYGGAATVAYVSERALCDESGKEIVKEYLKTANFTPIEGVIELEEQPNAGFHNSFFRGKNIADKYKDGSLWEEISAGSFTDMFVGDYIDLGDDITIKILGFDMYLNNGDSSNVCTEHHILCCGTKGIFHLGGIMNATDDTTGGYLQSAANTADSILPTTHNIAASIAIIKTQLDKYPEYGENSSKVYPIRHLVSNGIEATVANGFNPNMMGAAKNWEWTTLEGFVPTEVEMYGARILSSSGYDVGTGKTQIPYFRLGGKVIVEGRQVRIDSRGVASASEYAGFDPEIGFMPIKASTAYGLHCFCLKG